MAIEFDELFLDAIEPLLRFLELRAAAVDRLKGGVSRDRKLFVSRHYQSTRSSLSTLWKPRITTASKLLRFSLLLIMNWALWKAFYNNTEPSERGIVGGAWRWYANNDKVKKLFGLIRIMISRLGEVHIHQFMIVYDWGFKGKNGSLGIYMCIN